MQARTQVFEADAALVWQPVRARRPRKARAPTAKPAGAEPALVAAPARRPGSIRPAMGDALELALFIAMLAASALLHLGALVVVW
jgi:hypothetical protein